LKAILFLGLVCAGILASAAPCTYTDATSKTAWDLSGLRKTGDNYAGGEMGTKRYNYFLNVCDQLNGKPDCIGKKTGDTICTAGQWELAGGLAASLGAFTGGQPTWSQFDAADPGKGVKYQFNNGDECFTTSGWIPRIVNINFRCKMAPKPGGMDFSVEEQDGCIFQVNFDGQGCPGQGPSPTKTDDGGGLSGGWVFVIILIVLSAVYVLAGCIYKSQKQGTKGVESCPNIDFWRELPGLVKAGCSYTFNMIKSGCKSGHASSYEAV